MSADTMDLSGIVRANKGAQQDDKPAFSPSELYGAYFSELKNLKGRLLPQSALCGFMCLLTILSKLESVNGFYVSNLRVFGALLLVCQIVCCLLTPQVFEKSLRDLRSLRFSGEVLLSVAQVFTGLHSLWLIASPDLAAGLPFCAVCSAALVFHTAGETYRLRAGISYLKVLSSSDTPQGVFRRSGDWDGGDILVKCGCGVDRLDPRSTGHDPSQKVFRYFFPALLILVIVSSLIVLLSGAGFGSFLRCISCLSTACCGFASTLCMNLPLCRLNSYLQKRGAAAASWEGIGLLRGAAGAVVTDEDLFPPGRVSIVGMKIIGSASIEWAISAAASVIDYSGSAMGAPFLQLMNDQCGSLRRITSFESLPGGYIAGVQNSTVLMGTLDFMLQQGVYIHKSLVFDHAVYMAAGGGLCAVYLMSYTASNAARSVFSALCGSVKTIIATRDFTLTRRTMAEYYGSDAEKCAYPDLSESGRLADLEGNSRPIGVVCRSGLSPYAWLITRCKRAYAGAVIAMVLFLTGAVLGLELMFFLSLSSNFGAASAANLLLYCLLWLIPIWIVSSRGGAE